MAESILLSCRRIIDSFLDDKGFSDFHEPVKWKELGLTDYLDVIKYPMDLSSVKNRLAENKYIDHFEFAYDMRQIWKNCYLYNGETSYISDIAKKGKTLFEESFTRVLNNYVSRLPSVQVSSRRKLLQDIIKLKPRQMSIVIQLLWDICPISLEDTEENVDIDVDRISKFGYYMIMAYIDSVRRNTDLSVEAIAIDGVVVPQIERVIEEKEKEKKEKKEEEEEEEKEKEERREGGKEEMMIEEEKEEEKEEREEEIIRREEENYSQSINQYPITINEIICTEQMPLDLATDQN